MAQLSEKFLYKIYNFGYYFISIVQIMMKLLIFFIAAVAEIAGCFSFWLWLKLEKSILWLIPGTLSLWLFAYFLTLIELQYAGRIYATYGAIYIFSSIMWMWIIERNTPDKLDIIGILISLTGAIVIAFAPRT